MLRTTFKADDIEKATAGLEEDVAGFVTAAMGDTVDQVKEVFRDQIRGAGLGDRLARAVRGQTFPSQKGKVSLEPTGWIYAEPSKTGRGAAAIIDSYANGRTIVPRAGKRWLLVPTEDCPKKRSGEAFSYDEVEQRFGKLEWIPADQKFASPSARGRGSFHVVSKSAVIRKKTQRWRRASPKELTGKTRNPRPVQTVIMFTAVRAVRKPKTVDLSVPQTFAEARFPANLDNRWR